MTFTKTPAPFILALIGVTGIWGLTFPLIKGAVESFPPFAFVALRFLLAAGVVGAGYAWRARRHPRAPANVAELKISIGLGAFLFMGYAFQTWGLKFTSASNAGFITGMSVVLVPLIALVTERIAVRPAAAFGIGLSVLGLALLSQAGVQGANRGDLLVMICAFGFALHIAYVSKFAVRLDPVRSTVIQLAACGGLGLIASLSFEGAALVQMGANLLVPQVMGSLLFCAVLATALAYVVQNVTQRKVTAVQTALIFACEPVFAALFAYGLDGEVLVSLQKLGCALLIAGSALAEIGEQAYRWTFRRALAPTHSAGGVAPSTAKDPPYPSA